MSSHKGRIKVSVIGLSSVGNGSIVLRLFRRYLPKPFIVDASFFLIPRSIVLVLISIVIVLLRHTGIQVWIRVYSIVATGASSFLRIRSRRDLRRAFRCRLVSRDRCPIVGYIAGILPRSCILSLVHPREKHFRSLVRHWLMIR